MAWSFVLDPVSLAQRAVMHLFGACYPWDLFGLKKKGWDLQMSYKSEPTKEY